MKEAQRGWETERNRSETEKMTVKMLRKHPEGTLPAKPLLPV